LRDLLLLVPTRGRRRNVERLLAAVEATCETADVLLVTDHDDPACDGLVLPSWARIEQGPRATVSVKVNRHALPEAGRYGAVMFAGDDNVPDTPGWDRMLLEAADGGMSYPDTCHRTDIPEVVLISAPVIKALGWFYPPTIAHYFADDVWGAVGFGAGCLTYEPRVVFRHFHYRLAAGVARDATYAIAEAHWDADEAAWKTWQRDQSATDIATVQAAVAAARRDPH